MLSSISYWDIILGYKGFLCSWMTFKVEMEEKTIKSPFKSDLFLTMSANPLTTSANSVAIQNLLMSERMHCSDPLLGNRLFSLKIEQF